MFFRLSGYSLVPCACGRGRKGGASLASVLLCVCRAWVTKVLWAEIGGGIIFVTSGEDTGQHTKLPVIWSRVEVTPLGDKPYMLALAGRPSLHGYDACMVCWVKGGTSEKLQANFT